MMDNTPLQQITALEAPTFHNTTAVLTLAGVPMTLWDVTKAGLSGRLNLGLYGVAGMGKSQLLADVHAMFGNNAGYVLGRNDLDVKALFRQLKFKKLHDAMQQGGTVTQAELTGVTTNIYRPLIVVEEINRMAEAVQNQTLNLFEGFIELDGEKYALGGSELKTFHDLDGREWQQNVIYSVGVWSANFGNGQYTGTVSMDKALKERSHLIIDVDNFTPHAKNLDHILLGSGAEIRPKEQEKPEDRTALFTSAFEYLKQRSYTPNPQELGEELLLFRYLVLGLDYIPCANADNSKRKMKDVWPSKAEEDNIGTDESDKILYRMLFPASVRGAMTIISFARALREYVKVKNPDAAPIVAESVVESFKLVGAYSGMIENPQRVREGFVGNPYRAACTVATILQEKLIASAPLREAVIHYSIKNEALPSNVADACKADYACFKE